jgi:hypothetical protein
MPGQSGRQGREPTPAQKMEAARLRADMLLRSIQERLVAVAEFADLRNADLQPSAETGCTRGGGDHHRHVRVVPRPPRPTTHLACAVQRRQVPAEVLMAVVIQPLKRAGYAVSRPTTNNCGCITFNVMPNQWAAR